MTSAGKWLSFGALSTLSRRILRIQSIWFIQSKTEFVYLVNPVGKIASAFEKHASLFCSVTDSVNRKEFVANLKAEYLRSMRLSRSMEASRRCSSIEPRRLNRSLTILVAWSAEHHAPRYMTLNMARLMIGHQASLKKAGAC